MNQGQDNDDAANFAGIEGGNAGGEGDAEQQNECGVCSEDGSSTVLYQIGVGGGILCHNCIIMVFQRAVDSEFAYPARYLDNELRLEYYGHLIPANLAQQYARKEVEYAIATPADRIYCECGHFLGGRTGDRNATTAAVHRCFNCGTGIPRTYCQHCGTKVNAFNLFGAPHDCGPTWHNEEFEQQQAFAGMELGKDYQICPRCERKAVLEDGCHHMTCACGEQYCFVCGVAATEADGHWRRREDVVLGTCPRYPLPPT